MDLSDPGIELESPALQADSLPIELSGKPQTLKDDAIKGFTQYVSKSGRLNIGRMTVLPKRLIVSMK